MNEIRCPACEKSFASTLDHCPHCGAASLWKSPRSRPPAFALPAAPAPDLGAAPVPAGVPAAPLATQYARDWHVTRAGVMVLWCAVMAGMGVTVLNASLAVVSVDEGLLRPLLLIAFIALALVSVVAAVGMSLVSVVPRHSGLNAYAWGVRICLGLVIPLAIVTAFVLVGARGRTQLTIGFLGLVSALVVAVVLSLFLMLLLRGIARLMGDFMLGGGFVAYFVVALIVQFSCRGAAIALLAGERSGTNVGSFGLFLSFGLAVISLILQGWLCSLLASLNQRMRAALR